MKILYIVTKSTYGGVQTHIYQCAKFMKENGHTVYVMAHSNKNQGLEGEIKKLNIEFYKNDFLQNSFNPSHGLKAIFLIRKVLKKIQPDIVSCHSSAAGFWGRLAILNKVPTVFTAHGWGFTQGSNLIRGKIILLTEKLVSSYCKKIICVSENDKRLALRHNIVTEPKLITIHNGVEIQQKFKVSDKKETPIIFIGRLTKAKNPKKIVQSYINLPDNLKLNSRLYIIGEGEERKYIKKLISDNNASNVITMLGSLPRKEVLNFLRDNVSINGGIFTLISDYEGFPRSILEAMSFGYVVIASDVGGVSEIISSDVGILVKRGNVSQFSNALIKLLEDSELRKKLSANSIIKISTEFSLEKMLTKTKEVYDSLLVSKYNLNSSQENSKI